MPFSHTPKGKEGTKGSEQYNRNEQLESESESLANLGLNLVPSDLLAI